MLGEGAYDAIASAVDRLGPRPRVSDLDSARVLQAAQRDKKVRAGKMAFVLPTRIGRVVVEPDVQPSEVTRALKVMAGREALQG